MQILKGMFTVSRINKFYLNIYLFNKRLFIFVLFIYMLCLFYFYFFTEIKPSGSPMDINCCPLGCNIQYSTLAMAISNAKAKHCSKNNPPIAKLGICHALYKMAKQCRIWLLKYCFIWLNKIYFQGKCYSHCMF